MNHSSIGRLLTRLGRAPVSVTSIRGALVAGFARAHFTHGDGDNRMAPDVEVCLYRIVQEALTNRIVVTLPVGTGSRLALRAG